MQLVGVLVLVVLGAGHPRVVAGIYMPAIVLAAVGSPLFMDNLSHPRNEKR